eukprot:CAMPEP_0196819708 /NCGR_PEP_ID=MMETSP1362-20130617/71828_1 /TAXON_ID=163516 /ORGANISM="Leptocylindrus danicus, Strain CCMP1856" /LENGTH=410 /DNA_ID=CAMNT_0042198289 /DNA_START=177 /DNA_END=1409 /DNA_ORIENTATION=+
MKSQLKASSSRSSCTPITTTPTLFTLEKHGCCQIEIPLHQQEILAKGFKTAIAGMDSVCIGPTTSTQNVDDILRDADAVQDAQEVIAVAPTTTHALLPMLNKNDDAQHATGYHPAGGTLSRYNIFREGFVFSDNNLFDVDAVPEFRENMLAMRQVLHSLAMTALNMLGYQMDDLMGFDSSYSGNISQLEQMLRGSAGDDDDDGDGDGSRTSSSYLDGFSQWHVKRYQPPPVSTSLSPSTETAIEDDDSVPLLGQHTDPSILSIVVHDVPGINEGCIGLEVQNCEEKGCERGSSSSTWVELPHHGHGICTVLIGGAMTRISPECKKFQPCIHRVRGLDGKAPTLHRSRVAATYFFRPAPRTMIYPIDIDKASSAGNAVKKRVPRSRRPISFNDWCNKVSRNYGKSKTKGST